MRIVSRSPSPLDIIAVAFTLARLNVVSLLVCGTEKLLRRERADSNRSVKSSIKLFKTVLQSWSDKNVFISWIEQTGPGALTPPSIHSLVLTTKQRNKWVRGKAIDDKKYIIVAQTIRTTTRNTQHKYRPSTWLGEGLGPLWMFLFPGSHWTVIGGN